MLAPELSYDGLADIAEGGAASAALYRLATGQFQRGESPQTLRSSLLRYCATDTVALALVHRALADLAVEAPQPAPT